jgi:isopentenyl-diphosphate delta-isomerase
VTAPAGGDEDVVVLVDDDGVDLGTAPKLAAHQGSGRLHRAISVFVFTTAGDLVLQRRAASKYHFAGLWSNTCCSHPRPGEAPVAAGERRLAEEMGLSCPLREVGVLRYEARDEASGLVEREVDHLLVGVTDASPSPDPAEADDLMVVSLSWLLGEIAARPAAFTPWFPAAAAIVAGDSGVVWRS